VIDLLEGDKFPKKKLITDFIFCDYIFFLFQSLIVESGDVYTWGRNTYGQLGKSKEQLDFRPSKVPLLENIKHIVAGSEHSMALDKNGELWIWGWNEHGSCGNGTQTDQYFPQNITHYFEGKIDSIGSGAGHCFAWVQS